MTLARRLAAVERSLTPTQLVLRWLGEAHVYGSFDAYARALLDGEPEDVPLTRLCREAERSALFPETAAAWETQLRETRKLAAMALGLADLEDIEPPAEDADEQVLSRLVETMLDDLVEWSKVTALEKFGEGERGLAIARDWLRPRLAVRAPL